MPGGSAWLDEGGFHIQGKEERIDINPAEIEHIEMYKRGGSMSVIKVRHESGCVHLAVVRFMIGGYFATVNYFASRVLYDELLAAARGTRR